ncbi:MULTISPECIES: SixA phosphatase family protein [unclassified Sphingomonas]|uniref:SixA phosphatase family protein n=1 Tax=unclassified Sphingomonas TaxID=196159 RepID=UPI0006F4FCC6|nr:MULTISPECIES: histidine phosphatase family protein [unclassified Sphingomonas]KQS48234.1 phosphohistidine phosphatase [Sphingomonas sp. Leaf198]
MKTLTLLRHAKSGWDDPVARDFDRPLNAKGKRAAAMVGRHMRSLGLAFDHAIASPAVRVSETLEQIESGYGRTIAPNLDRRVYLASAATLLDVVHGFPAESESALLVGHNPGLEDLVLMLVADGADPLRDAVEDKYPTASIAELQFEGDWGDVATGTARLTRFIRPRDLDPTLGPDAD